MLASPTHLVVFKALPKQSTSWLRATSHHAHAGFVHPVPEHCASGLYKHWPLANPHDEATAYNKNSLCAGHKSTDITAINYTSVDPKQFIRTKTQPHMKGAKGSQDHLKAQRMEPHQPTPNPAGREPKGAETTSEPKEGGHPNQRPTPHEGSQREPKPRQSPRRPTPTNTKAIRSKVALRTPIVNCLGKKNWPKSRVSLILCDAPASV